MNNTTDAVGAECNAEGPSETAGSAEMTRREFEAFITKPEVAKRMRRTVRTVDNLMKRRLIPFYKIGRSVAFRWSEIEAHLAATCRVVGRGGK